MSSQTIRILIEANDIPTLLDGVLPKNLNC